MNMFGFMAFSLISTIIVVSLVAAFNLTLEKNLIRESARQVHQILSIYRGLHCDLASGTNRTSLDVLSDTDVFPTAATDPALGLFAWSYRAGDNSSGSFVASSTDDSVLTTIQVTLGGQREGLNDLVIDLPRTRALNLPHFAGATDERWDYANVPTPAIRCT